MSIEELANMRQSISSNPNLSEQEKNARIKVVQALMENIIVQEEYNNQMSEFINKSVELGKLRGESFKIDPDIRYNEVIMKDVIKDSDLLKYFEQKGIDSFTLDDIKMHIPLYEQERGTKLTETSLAVDLLDKVEIVKQLEGKQKSIISSKLGDIIGKELVTDYVEKGTVQPDGKVVFEQTKKDEQQLEQDYRKALEKIEEMYVNEGLLDLQSKNMATNMLNQLYGQYIKGFQRVPVEKFEEMMAANKAL